MNKIVITGGPHSGKSTLIAALGERYPEAYLLGEPATSIINQERSKQSDNEDYEPILPSNNSVLFNRMVMAKYVEQENSLAGKSGVTFQDRILWDSVAYCRLAGDEALASEAEELAKTAEYTYAFFCELVGTYTLNGIRSSTAESAAIKHKAVREAYESSGLSVISLPPVSVVERIQIVSSNLSEIL